MELTQFPAETRNGAAARELDARMQARVAAVADATVEAIEIVEERVASLEGQARSRSPDREGQASTMEADLRSFDGDKTAKAKKVGELLAARAKDAGIEAVVFDRGGNRYAGRVAAIADGAREGGLTL